MSDELARLRREYGVAGVREADLPADPIALFRGWFADAAALQEPNAMVLATATAEGAPSARSLLLKGLDDRGFRFFTNLASRKAHELAANPRCALLFAWWPLERQVRVEGRAEPLPREEVAAYFASRPRGAQLGAWASPQSSVVTAEGLQRRYAEVEQRFPDDVPLPDFWGGYVVVPRVVEFWQGRQHRMHDRWRYSRVGVGTEWTIDRLAP